MNDRLDRLRRTGTAKALGAVGLGAQGSFRDKMHEDEQGIVRVADDLRGLPSGETSIEELRENADQDNVFGVSMAELRALSGIPDPFGPVKFTSEGLDNSELEVFRDTRNHGERDPDRRRAIVERVNTMPVVDPVDDRPRVYNGRDYR